MWELENKESWVPKNWCFWTVLLEKTSLLEFVQTHVYWASDAIQPSYPLLPTFFSCPQSFLASGSFPMSQLFTSSGQSIGASDSASILPKNIHGWFPLRLTDLISLQSKGLSSVFSSTTIRKHQFLCSQSSFWFNSYICIHGWIVGEKL